VVGECVTNNCNYGEALSGPLPENYRPIKQLASEGSYIPAYQNAQTGLVQREDPRLTEPLPSGWKLMKDNSDPYIQWFRREETDEDTWFDPRLTAVALRARGVNVQRFKLI
jgi:hypothetical protein